MDKVDCPFGPAGYTDSPETATQLHLIEKIFGDFFFFFFFLFFFSFSFLFLGGEFVLPQIEKGLFFSRSSRLSFDSSCSSPPNSSFHLPYPPRLPLGLFANPIMAGPSLAMRSMATRSMIQLPSLSRQSIATSQVLRAKPLRPLTQSLTPIARRGYADAAPSPSPSPSPAPKPKKRFRFLRWAWRLTWLTGLGLTGAMAYSIYELRHPEEQFEPDPSKKTLVILGMTMSTSDMMDNSLLMPFSP